MTGAGYKSFRWILSGGSISGSVLVAVGLPTVETVHSTNGLCIRIYEFDTFRCYISFVGGHLPGRSLLWLEHMLER